jgi:hypothetical protein
VDELYVVARRVLLDALDALREHRHAVVLVGAQAVYLRVAEADLLRRQFAVREGLGVEMTLRAVGPLADSEEVAASCEVLASDLLRAIDV